jgi:tetratricopeptide (TPR) repeat protein
VRAALFGTGIFGALVFVLMHALTPASLDGATMFLAVLGALTLVPHAGFSWLRAWRAGGGSRALLVATAVLAGAAAAIGVAAGGLVYERLWTLALCIFPLHVALQTYRVGRVFVARAGGGSSGAAWLALASVALAGVGALGVLAGPRAPLLLRGFLPPMLPAVAGVSVVIVLVVAVALARTPRTLLWCLPLFVVSAAMWSVPGLVDGTGTLDPVATADGAFAIGHGAQLAWLALAAETRLATLRGKSFDPYAWAGLALVLGALVLIDLPWVASRLMGLDLATSLLAVGAAMSIQVAVLDAWVFRLSEPSMRRALLEATAPAPSGIAEVSNRRALAFALPGLLVCLGLVVDLQQTWRVRGAAEPKDLAIALMFHPSDARALLRASVGALVAGALDEARESLTAVDKTRAFSPAAARLKVELCTRTVDDVKTPGCFVGIPKWLEEEPAILALAAAVSLRVREPHRAKVLALQARERLPNDPRVLATLGIAEARLGETSARAHLLESIRILTEKLGADPLLADPGSFETGLALAELARKEKDYAGALEILDKVVGGAEATGRASLVMRATAERARLLDISGDLRRALDDYQRALRLAPSADLPVEEVLLWSDYSALLVRSDAPVELRFACVLRGAEAGERVPEDHPEKKRVELLTTANVTTFEAALDRMVAARVRAELDKLTEEALSVRYE